MQLITIGHESWFVPEKTIHGNLYPPAQVVRSWFMGAHRGAVSLFTETGTTYIPASEDPREILVLSEMARPVAKVTEVSNPRLSRLWFPKGDDGETRTGIIVGMMSLYVPWERLKGRDLWAEVTPLLSIRCTDNDGVITTVHARMGYPEDGTHQVEAEHDWLEELEALYSVLRQKFRIGTQVTVRLEDGHFWWGESVDGIEDGVAREPLRLLATA